MENNIETSIFLDNKKLFIRFKETGIVIEVPLSDGQYKIILDGINKDFLNYNSKSDFDSVPTDDELGLLSGLRYMVPMDSLNSIYSSEDKVNRIIMIQVDAIKEVLCVFKISLKNKVVPFDVPISWLKKFKQNVDFGNIEILEDGKLVSFGDLKIESINLINWFYNER